MTDIVERLLKQARSSEYADLLKEAAVKIADLEAQAKQVTPLKNIIKRAMASASSKALDKMDDM